jgi:hypothetical protein
MSMRTPSTLANGLIILACVWLFVSPWLLGYNGGAGWNSTIVAAAVTALAVIRLAGAARVTGVRRLDWLTVLLGAWLIAAPWVLSDYDDAATWNSVIVGLVIGLLALGSVMAARGMGEAAGDAGAGDGAGEIVGQR